MVTTNKIKYYLNKPNLRCLSQAMKASSEQECILGKG